MKTAEEMIIELDNALNFNDVKKLMVQYATQALKQAAEKAQIKWIDVEYDEEKRDMIREPEINKSSILNLINELK